MNYHYSILIQWSDEDQKYVVSAPLHLCVRLTVILQQFPTL
jgi:hypothetical protein